MFWKLVSLVILGAILAIHSEASQGFAVPPHSLVERLRQQHHRSDWLRISTDSVRFDARVREIGAQGLNGISPRRHSILVPEDIPWASVGRLDRLRSRSRIGQVLGLAAGGTLGLAVSTGTGASTGGGIACVVLGAAGGAWLGGYLGGKWVRERPLYVGSPAPDSAAPAGGPADSSGTTQAVPVASASSATSNLQDSIRIERAVNSLRPNQLLRIRGRVGEFEGFVDRAGPDGLEGLRPNRREDWSTPWPRELSWDRIGQIDRRGNSAGRGALVGTVSCAGLGLIVGMAAAAGYSMGGATTGEIVEVAAVGALVGGVLGASLGGLIGYPFEQWHLVYRRP